MIGPTFLAELRAAGVDQVRCSWQRDTGAIEFDEAVTPDDKAAVLAVLAAHNPLLGEATRLIDKQITDLEAALPITPRALREFMLMVLNFAHIPLSVNSKFQAIGDLDVQVQTLRAQRK